MGRTAAIRRLALAGLVLLTVTACTASVRNHGYAPDDAMLNEIIVGIDTRATVDEIVGPPSTSGMLQGGDYYYIESQVRSFAYQAPEVIDRQVVAISFDEADVVSNIERFGLEDGQVVPISRRVTDSGASIGFLRQLLGNLGRFNPADLLDQ